MSAMGVDGKELVAVVQQRLGATLQRLCKHVLQKLVLAEIERCAWKTKIRVQPLTFVKPGLATMTALTTVKKKSPRTDQSSASTPPLPNPKTPNLFLDDTPPKSMFFTIASIICWKNDAVAFSRCAIFAGRLRGMETSILARISVIDVVTRQTSAWPFGTRKRGAKMSRCGTN